MFHNGMTNNDQDYEMCFRIDNVVLPKNGYFGISAATGMLYNKNIEILLYKKNICRRKCIVILFQIKFYFFHTLLST